MTISRREFFRQVPGKRTLRSLGQIASSLGLGHLIADDADSPGTCEEAGLALRRKDAASWLDSFASESAGAGPSGAAPKQEVPGHKCLPARSDL
jgi:hypothetical protein